MTYRIYDLCVKSDLAFPELPSHSSSHVDLFFDLADSSPAAALDQDWVLVAESALRLGDRPARSTYRNAWGYLIRAINAGDFLVAADGGRVICHPLPDAPDDEIWAFFLGPVLAHCCHLRGMQVLHASAVVLDGRAVGFMGEAGVGKSSLAAAFLTAGFPLLTDDVLVVDTSGGTARAMPSYPALRMRSDALASFFEGSQQFRPAPPDFDKWWVPVWQSFWNLPCEIAALYLLNGGTPGETPDAGPRVIQPALSTANAVVSFLSNTFGSSLLDAGMRARQFDGFCRLAKEVPVREVSFKQERDSVSDIQASILADLAQAIRQ
jgi:hypothetical protein